MLSFVALTKALTSSVTPHLCRITLACLGLCLLMNRTNQLCSTIVKILTSNWKRKTLTSPSLLVSFCFALHSEFFWKARVAGLAALKSVARMICLKGRNTFSFPGKVSFCRPVTTHRVEAPPWVPHAEIGVLLMRQWLHTRQAEGTLGCCLHPTPKHSALGMGSHSQKLAIPQTSVARAFCGF